MQEISPKWEAVSHGWTGCYLLDLWWARNNMFILFSKEVG
jgi:hypothetical protein